MKTAFSILLLMLMSAPIRAQGLDLQADLLQAIANKNYEQPTQAELSRAKGLFGMTLKGEGSAAELATNWTKLGFDFREVEKNGEKLWLVSEPPTRQSGRGWYLFRTNRKTNIGLEAPHARNDIHTGLIAFRFFCAGTARAMAASTITRHTADMGHLEDTYYQAFTLAFAEACPGGLIAQVHGFESENHTSVKTDIVASAGTHSPGRWFAQLVEDLRHATALRVLAYPRDTRALGATLNTQGQALQKTGRCRFVHLEITAQVRELLTRDEALCRTAMECLSRCQPQ